MEREGGGEGGLALMDTIYGKWISSFSGVDILFEDHVKTHQFTLLKSKKVTVECESVNFI